MALDLSKYTVKTARPLPVLLLLDGSGSMMGSKIESLNKAVNEMVATFKSLSAKEIEINLGVITFGGSVDYQVKMQPVKDIAEIHLEANGGTPMGTTLQMAKDLLEDKEIIPSKGYRPTVILVSDGEPTDNWQGAMNAFVSEGRSSKCDRFAIAIDGEGEQANRSILSQFLQGTENSVLVASDADKIARCFKLVTMSVSVRSKSKSPNSIPQIAYKGSSPKSNSIVNIDEVKGIDSSDVDISSFDDFIISLD